MIEAKNVTFSFDQKPALSNLNCQISGGCIYGLVGSNGAGKSTFLRLISGVLKPNQGELLIDAAPVYDNPEVKQKLFLFSDELYFLPQTTMDKMAEFYSNLYPRFSMDRYHNLTQKFGLNPRSSLNTFSKGMRRQAATVLGLATQPQYIFFDETFDGLDPVMRNLLKDIIRSDVREEGATVIIASHSLRELEDTCDQLALLHRGGIIFESDIADLKTSLFKVQFAMQTPYDQQLFEGIDIKNAYRHGAVTELIVHGDREATLARLRAHNPVLLDILPLTLEEVFVYEMEALGYAYKDILS